ncbi:helix-turn-helix domain-containing protein [Mycobacterium sp. IS-3022]|uniref:PucR family transcriptional regulator n=1 Tax=Mycobacterium sp. IS-3022 TaxID=1772277 RepID=UPI0007415835|nr:helix-turn-helix domain-containing protein [Mycobacterium sp. IS-3022]KUH95553.1 PucR protein [Mycobacterium sp. IS-3022]
MSRRPVRMSELGSDPASVLRIIAYFDELDESAASADTVVRSAALLAECPVGARWASGVVVRYDSVGELDTTGSVPAAPSVDDEPVVWVERGGGPSELDPVLIDRVSHSLRRVLTRSSVTPQLGDPALLEVVLSEKEHREDRARAIRLLGLDETRKVRVLAVSAQSPSDALQIITRELADVAVRTVAIGNATAVLCQHAGDTRALSDGLERAIVDAFPPPRRVNSDRGPWVGIGSSGSVLAAPTSWHQAMRALRFASSTGYGRRAIAYERLSLLELLADLPLDRVRGNREMARIDEIAATPTGALAVQTVEAFLVFGSLRRTAAELHVHHSTVAARLAQVARTMGWDLDDPMDRFLATLVLMVRRIALSSEELLEPDTCRVYQRI